MRLRLSAILLAVSLLMPAGLAYGQLVGAPISAATLDSGRVLQSVTARGTVFNQSDLTTGALDLVTTIDESGTFQGSFPNRTAVPGLSSFDLDLILAKNDVAGTLGVGPSDPANPANPIDVINFGADVGVISGNWRGTNGAADDFVLFEVSPGGLAPDAGDLIDIQAILPGGVFGTPVFLPQVNPSQWFDTGIQKSGNPNSGQNIYGLSFSVQELRDQNNAPLAANAELVGLRILTANADLALVAATKNASALQLNVNTTTGAVSISNPNATTYTLGTNFYRLTSPSAALRNDTWTSLDDSETVGDGPGLGWVEGGGSFSPATPPGDYNGDGSVDAADYTVWRDGGAPDDTQAGYDLWDANYGATALAGATNQLVELRNEGIASIGPGQTLSLGNAFRVGGAQDITFTYSTREGLLVTGSVVYTGSAVSVPEPAAASLLALLASLLVGGRRRSCGRFAGFSLVSSTLRPKVTSMRYAAPLALAALIAVPASADIVYDGDETVNVLSGATFTYANAIAALPNNGDSGWFTRSVLPLTNLSGIGAAGSAAGVSGSFLSYNTTADGAGAGAIYVVRDNFQTTGLRDISFNFYFNDATPNTPDDNPANNSGGNIAFRVTGITPSGTLSAPWASSITLSGGAGRSGADIAAGRYNNGTDTAEWDHLLRDATNTAPESGGAINSRFGEWDESGDWQTITRQFDAGAGYEWLIFGFAGGSQSASLSGASAFAFDNVNIDVGFNPQPSLSVNRSTGQVSITNAFELPFDITGYTIRSNTGSLESAGWTPIDGRLDAASNGGNGSFDPDSAWNTITTSPTALAESAATGNGGQLTSLGTVALGAAYNERSPFADVTFEFTLAGGGTVPGVVTYTGSGPALGDFDANGTIDAADFQILANGSYTNLSGLSRFQSYQAGDLNGDGDNDFGDFQQFRALFEAASPGIAFSTITGVPEPSAALLCLLGVGGLAGGQRRRG